MIVTTDLDWGACLVGIFFDDEAKCMGLCLGPLCVTFFAPPHDGDFVTAVP